MVVGVSGYGYTGSGAIYDLLREYEELVPFNSTDRDFEFTLPYESDCLLTLENAISVNPIKHFSGDLAIHRFKKMLNYIGHSWDIVTENSFSVLSKEYLESLIQVTYKCQRPYDYQSSKLSIFLYKLSCVITNYLEKETRHRFLIGKEQNRYISVHPNDFLTLTKKYISDILLCNTSISRTSNVLLNQPFPPNIPESVFHYFDDPYAIIVDRDPRDIYVMVKHFALAFGRFIPSDNVEDFVKYYRLVRYRRDNEDSQHILRINFEDLVYEYDATVAKIEDFLHIKKHIDKFNLFNPEISVKNTQMMNFFEEDKEAIQYIENNLAEYLFDFSKYDKVALSNDVFEMRSW